ncbi:uncharacterized protein PHACADRAFT_90851 [Phanerochaete carnosa HHB-10118-sp]|uniref:Uncharacterized protein n=1 Tax=Phanerochaete carnosa (strain HHB-10118-sp) TaxID=650164 RepID=K5W3I0_PHACS|nr:uncharacterized protein PHACADRAFT_90851 [Phanerochaete carnosa HHB-10118-sp]EKM58418.1 hypothetical protein PHACADRAFT_90851 [Phanerochaete carnosa HHB-10118-sp]
MSRRNDEEQSDQLLAPTPEYLASVKVFPLIPNIKKDVMVYSALSWDQLTASDINFAIIRPLVFKYAKLENTAVVYACFVVRSHFLSEVSAHLAYSGLMLTRAHVCEILAMKLLACFSSNELQLASTLTASWNPLAGAPAEVILDVRDAVGGDGQLSDPQCALEMAIATQSKHFLSSPLVQAVVNDIYRGRVIFSMTSYNSVLADNYKPRSIEIYNPHNKPFLDHYRLRVPRYGAILEFINFVALLSLFLLALSNKDLDHMTPFEVVFIIFATAFALDEYTASKEHGWGIYIANIWNVFDTSFIIICVLYLVFRIKGLVHHDPGASDLAFDILACGACILFPRLAFFAIKNNVVVLALRAMAADFIFFIGMAAICFSGLLYTLHSLAGDKWSVKSTAWLMVQIWFGNTYLSFAQAESFHPVFGPILMTCFAALSNTLLLTILISILSNTFARIDANATQEYLFQFAISTIEGVKSDALFSYQPPFNLFAFLILWPLSCILTPRALHSANVFLIKLTSFPWLIAIAIYERYLAQGRHFRESSSATAHDLYNSALRGVKHVPFLERLVGASTADLYDAIFDVDAPEAYELFASDEDDGDGDDRPAPTSARSRDSVRPPSPGSAARRPRGPRRTTSLRSFRTPRSPRSPPGGSPAMRATALPDLVAPYNSAELPTAGPRSPLSRLFTARGAGRRTISASHERLAPPGAGTAAAPAVDERAVRRLEGLVDEIRALPVNRLKEEMKELQDRQARIENLLMMLTRGMRNETAGSYRQSTL